MLRIDPRKLTRLDELETDLLARREHAHTEGWLGELEGLDLTLRFLADKRDEAQRLTRPRDLARHAHDREPRMTTTPKIHLDAGDAAEITEALTFIADWLRSDHARLEASLREFVGVASYNLDTLRADLARLAFLLGDNGVRLFGEQQP